MMITKICDMKKRQLKKECQASC